MSTLSDKMEAASQVEDRRRKDNERFCHLAHDCFNSEAGKELLAHLVARFDVCGRTFIPCNDSGDVNALRAAVRDGERAAIMYLVRLIRASNKDFPIPL